MFVGAPTRYAGSSVRHDRTANAAARPATSTIGPPCIVLRKQHGARAAALEAETESQSLAVAVGRSVGARARGARLGRAPGAMSTRGRSSAAVCRSSLPYSVERVRFRRCVLALSLEAAAAPLPAAIASPALSHSPHEMNAFDFC